MVLDENIFSLLCYEQVYVVGTESQRKRIYVSRTFPDQRRCMKQLWLDGEDLVLPNDTLLWVRGLPFRSKVEDPVLCYEFPLPKAKICAAGPELQSAAVLAVSE